MLSNLTVLGLPKKVTMLIDTKVKTMKHASDDVAFGVSQCGHELVTESINLYQQLGLCYSFLTRQVVVNKAHSLLRNQTNVARLNSS